MYTLYPWQEEAKQVVLETYETGINTALVVMATGLGKTLTAAEIIKEVLQKNPEAKVLFLAHTKEILRQNEEKCSEQQNHAFEVAFMTGEEKSNDHSSHITYATFQTMNIWKEAFEPEEFTLIVVDEAHHSQAPSYKEVLDYFLPTYQLAITATPKRQDGKLIEEIFGPPVYNLPLEEAFQKGYLPTVDYHLVTLNVDRKKLKAILDEHKETGKRYTLAQLNEQLFLHQRDEDIAARIMQEEQPFLIFCEGIEHVEHFKNFFPKEQTATMHSDQHPKKNANALQQFRDGEITYLLTINMLNEGIHVRAANVAFVRTTNSYTIFAQQLGRALDPTKEQATVLDFVANMNRITWLQETGMAQNKRTVLASEPLHLFDVLNIQQTEELLDLLEVLKQIEPTTIADVPHLLAQYHPTKNPLPPEFYTIGSGQIVWWQCTEKECTGEWEARVQQRAKGHRNCPKCKEREIYANSLAVKFPEIAKEWDPVKNGERTPENTTIGSTYKAYWICSEKECSGTWQATLSQRTRGTGKCPECK